MERDPIVLVVALEEGSGRGAADEIRRGATDSGGEIRLRSATSPVPRERLAHEILSADAVVLVAERWSEVSSFQAGRLVSSVERAGTRSDLANTVVSWFSGAATSPERTRNLTTFVTRVAARWGAVLVPPVAAAASVRAGGRIAGAGTAELMDAEAERQSAYALGMRVSQVAWATSELRPVDRPHG